VLDVELVVDGGWRGDQVALVDSFTVNDKTYETICLTDLAVTKTVSNPTPPQGTAVTFTVTLTNNGPAPATESRSPICCPTAWCSSRDPSQAPMTTPPALDGSGRPSRSVT
jgi:hypothetical protein